jgi:hypothetical protein
VAEDAVGQSADPVRVAWYQRFLGPARLRHFDEQLVGAATRKTCGRGEEELNEQREEEEDKIK